MNILSGVTCGDLLSMEKGAKNHGECWKTMLILPKSSNIRPTLDQHSFPAGKSMVFDVFFATSTTIFLAFPMRSQPFFKANPPATPRARAGLEAALAEGLGLEPAQTALERLERGPQNYLVN